MTDVLTKQPIICACAAGGASSPVLAAGAHPLATPPRHTAHAGAGAFVNEASGDFTGGATAPGTLARCAGVDLPDAGCSCVCTLARATRHHPCFA